MPTVKTIRWKLMLKRQYYVFLTVVLRVVSIRKSNWCVICNENIGLKVERQVPPNNFLNKVIFILKHKVP